MALTKEQRNYIVSEMNSVRLAYPSQKIPAFLRTYQTAIRRWEVRKQREREKVRRRFEALKNKLRYELNFGTEKTALAALKKLQGFRP